MKLLNPNARIEKIRTDFPDFAISSVQKAGEGDNSAAYIINHSYIFRFPKRKSGKFQLQREIAVLPLIGPFLPLKIPEFVLVSPTLAFAGHKMLRGEPLAGAQYHMMEEKYRKAAQESISDFLSAIHRVDISLLAGCGLETMDPAAEYGDNFEKIQKEVFPLLSIKSRKVVSRLFSDYLRDPRNFLYTPVLIHNDFSTDHILYDRLEKKISGIIDFGDMALGDPDYDGMYLLDAYGDGFISEILIRSGSTEKKEVMNKILFFSLANKLQILLEALKTQGNKETATAFQNLTDWILKYNARPEK
jgi:aminoglycoside 2''-phosphotransferase